MKKITLLVLCCAFSSLLFAQVDTYSTLTEFETAYTATLLQEDFSGGPTDPAICGTVVSSAGNDCFPAGELIDGFELTASEDSEIVYLPEGFLPSNNPTPRLGANAGVNYTIVSFTGSEDVFAVGFSIHIDNDADFNYRAFDQNNTLLYEGLVPFTSFFGIVSSNAIGRVEIEGVGEVGELMGDLKFGTENILAIDNLEETAFSYSPNPVSNLLNITSEKQINTISIINLLGQKLAEYTNFGTSPVVDVNSFDNDIYIVRLNFVEGQTGSFKFIKQ